MFREIQVEATKKKKKKRGRFLFFSGFFFWLLLPPVKGCRVSFRYLFYYLKYLFPLFIVGIRWNRFFCDRNRKKLLLFVNRTLFASCIFPVSFLLFRVSFFCSSSGFVGIDRSSRTCFFCDRIRPKPKEIVVFC